MTINDMGRPARAGSDYAELSRRVAGAGLLGRRPGYYLLRTGLIAALYGAGIAAFLALGDSWWQLALAAGFAIIFAQVALVAHDLAHRQVFRTRRPSELAGMLVGNLGIGMSYGRWMDNHTRHHANPNHEEHDPDVDPDVLVWSTRQAENSRGAARFIGRWQAFLFFPLLTLEGLNLHYGAVRSVLRRTVKRPLLEGTLLFVHFGGYLAALLLVLSPGKALAFFAVHQGLWGVYMGSIFAPGHKGMPMLGPGEKLDFLRRQVLTSRNVRGGLFVDNAMGGLNYQIEHHLFPHMPTPHLRRAQPIVRAYCAELGIPYHQTGLVRSWAEALGHLHRAGAPLRRNGADRNAVM
ncbi:fatty acid desaturase family protein [Amycolatopsis cihanbeyliensis]|uniref:Fatty acid desaturase n=1 Tax=Amycolatopsis cihanbeyliensis TaxID=1128664 RepID=A0A542DLJ4_AMYCI|nr:acyl-CoA desaturase [Amycolatopsis cihanbeyliensis]TQJ03956.1 fatty acid desaturase [Amycolatopsis cihanbeyliensis]